MSERTPLDLGDILKEIVVPGIGCALDLTEKEAKEEDLFAEHQRKSWDKSLEARCDFQRRVRLIKRGGVFFISIWQKSLMGRTLTDIKSDEEMVLFFASEVAALIREVIGSSLDSGDWCIVTTPKRRHTKKNFATAISIEMASSLHIPFYEDVCSCKTRQRVNAEFTINTLPKESNIIVFDDFCTTGSTLAAMQRAFAPHPKNLLFFVGINNKL